MTPTKHECLMLSGEPFPQVCLAYSSQRARKKKNRKKKDSILSHDNPEQECLCSLNRFEKYALRRAFSSSMVVSGPEP